MRVIFGAAVIVALSHAVDVTPEEELVDLDLDFAFAEHMTKYGLSFDSAGEHEMRREKFAEIDAIIRSHNANEDFTFTMGHNRFSTWTPEERS